MKIPVSRIVLGVITWAGAASGYVLADEPVQAPAWKRHTIDAADKALGKLGADGVRLGFANADRLPDVVTGWENGDAIRVCINPGPAKAKQPWPAVTVGRVAGAEDAVFSDLDGDGVLDVVSCTEGKTRSVFFHWAPHQAADYLDADQWKTVAVPALKGKGKWMFCLPFDVNADGRDDLIIGSKGGGGAVGWLERPVENPRDAGAWRWHRLCDAGWIMSIRADDIDGDGDRDVIFSNRKGTSAGVWLLENSGKAAAATGSVFSKPRRLGLAGEEVMFIDVADVNGDGRLDVAAAVRPGKIALLIQPPGPGDEWAVQLQSGGIPRDRFGMAKAVRVADLNLDGSLEVVVTCGAAEGALSGCFAVSLHTGPLGGELAYRNISGPEGVKFDRMELLDLDGDGDLDLITCEEKANLGVFWYENPTR